MKPGVWNGLRELLVSRYDHLHRRLARRLGSDDLAGDALQDTYLRLHGRDGQGGRIGNPLGYLYRAALNAAATRRRTDARLARRAEVLAELEPEAEEPGLELAEGLLQAAEVTAAMAKLPRRRLAVLVAAVQGTPHDEIGERLGISRRTVLTELKAAVVQLRATLEEE